MQDLRTGRISCQRLMALLQVVDPGLLDECTLSGRPTGASPLHLLVAGKDHELERVEILQEMIRLTASPSMGMRSNGASPLHRAAGTGAKWIVKGLLTARAHVNALNDNGATPLDMCYLSNRKVAALMTIFTASFQIF